MARIALLLVAAAATAACGSGPIDVQTAESVPLRLDRSDPERLLRSYLGGYVGPDGGDPFEAGLVSGEGRNLLLHPQKLDPAVRATLTDANGDGALDWDEFSVLATETYYAARALPLTLDSLRAQAAYDAASPDWFTVELNGVMTTARRRVYVPISALEAAMDAFETEGRMRYPDGTWLIGEHLVDGEVAETTVKHRRSDGFWDFAVYDASGVLAPTTITEPKALRAPIQCTGCHLGQKRFEPEKSFPREAPDGPHGPRGLYVEEVWRRPEAVALFDEHARRDDGVLGLYATLYAGRLMAERDAGAISPAGAARLQRLGL